MATTVQWLFALTRAWKQTPPCLASSMHVEPATIITMAAVQCCPEQTPRTLASSKAPPQGRYAFMLSPCQPAVCTARLWRVLDAHCASTPTIRPFAFENWPCQVLVQQACAARTAAPESQHSKQQQCCTAQSLKAEQACCCCCCCCQRFK
jgi:hypothetical protein